MIYTAEHLNFLKDNCKLSRITLTELFNKKFSTNQSISSIANICKRHRFLRDKKDWRFNIGNIPHNKGTKGISKPNSGSFKRGNQPHNTQPIGSECIVKDGYIKIKIAEPNKWIFKHRLIWEREKGPIPDGYCVSFLDCNPQNCDISNLILISKSENLIFNKSGFSYYPVELTQTLRIISKLSVESQKAIRKLGK